MLATPHNTTTQQTQRHNNTYKNTKRNKYIVCMMRRWTNSLHARYTTQHTKQHSLVRENRKQTETEVKWSKIISRSGILRWAWAITFRDKRNVECPHVWKFEWKLNYDLEKNMFWHLSLGLNMIGWSQKECRMPRYLKSLGPRLSGADSTIFRLDRLDNIAATFGISTVCQVNQKLHNYPSK